MLDAPVSGGRGGRHAGALTFMAGGNDKAFRTRPPYPLVMGKTVNQRWGPGNGQAAKILQQHDPRNLDDCVSEAFALGENSGLRIRRLFDIASRSSGQ